MNDLGIDADQVLSWFPHEKDTPYVLIRVTPVHAIAWVSALIAPVRRCYITDSLLEESAAKHSLPQSEIIAAKVPDAGSTMAGDFGEILVYLYQGARAQPKTVLGATKWRLKQDRTKPAPHSDVVHLVLHSWPVPSDSDCVLCSEVKTKSTNGSSTPIQSAIDDSAKDRTSRLARTLIWLRERALTEDLGDIGTAHLERFINAIDYPPASKQFSAVAVVDADLVESELAFAPTTAHTDYVVIVISIPELHKTYSSVYAGVRQSAVTVAAQQEEVTL